MGREHRAADGRRAIILAMLREKREVRADRLAPADVVERLKFIGMTVIQVRRNDFQN